ncbi:TPA: hypothetical protein MD817_001767 [Klebsiella oxytoca]|nr:hypothetical protein [Klebsiella oxytoca]HBV8800112.1 hypothetical protein [Klebsiella oxytoca]
MIDYSFRRFFILHNVYYYISSCLNDSQLHIWRAVRRKKQPGLFSRAMILLALPHRKGEVRSRETTMTPLNVPSSALKGRALFSLIFFTSPGLLAAVNGADTTKKPPTRP